MLYLPCKAVSGIPEMLKEMKAQGLKLGVLSNKPDRQAVHVVEEIFGKTSSTIYRGKKTGCRENRTRPLYCPIAAEFGSDPSETLYIGDSEVDGATGKAAGMDTVLVTWGFRSRYVLEAAEPYRIVDSTDEILMTIKEKG